MTQTTAKSGSRQTDVVCSVRQGMVVILSSPSGAGKSTIAQRILQHIPQITLSVSVTTRAPRAGEQEGVDYYFVKHDQFDEMAKRGELLESAMVFDHGYGTPKAAVLEKLAQGQDVLFDIDWQGAQQIRAALKDSVISLFILPPSREELEVRLRRRSTDAEEVIQKRMAKSDIEISHFDEYDWVLINDDLDHTCAQITQIITMERQRLRRQPSIYDFARRLLTDTYKK